MGPLFWTGVFTLILYALLGIDLVRGGRSIRYLRDVPPSLPEPAPKVSVIVPARNEERNIRQALHSLIHQNYPTFEIILVNDRSEDGTGAILDDLAETDGRLKVVHVTDLPPGWLGKNHGNWRGSLMASGDLLLFTDADVVMDPSLVRRAVSLLTGNRLDHLAATPETRMPGHFLDMFTSAFAFFFSLFTRPWKARDPKSRRHIGIGAFNLVRADAYRQVGGHRTIRLRPDDDLKLGKILKKAGYVQDLAYGTGLMWVEWYASVRDLIRGLEKNAFSGADYRISTILGGTIFHLVFTIWPYVALLATEGATRAVYAAVVLLLTLLLADSARFHGGKAWHALGFPATTLLFVYIILRTTVLNLLQGGISWRGTFYSLRELKSNRV